jgi:hypothetical protein
MIWRNTSFMRIAPALLLASLVCPAQTVKHIPAPVAPKQKIVQVDNRPVPFALDHQETWKNYPIEFRGKEQISQQDAQVESGAEDSIRELIKQHGLELNDGRWNYEQLVCSAFPKHLFFRFMRDAGQGDATTFTASIPMDGEGNIRIIPIQLRSYSLISPAPIKEMTISTFNHIRSEENPQGVPQADWIGTGLCYAALTGGNPAFAFPTANPEKQKFPVAQNARVEVPEQGGAILSFTDAGALPQPVEWTLKFDGKGKLLKVSRARAPLIQGYLYMHPASFDQAGKPAQ